MERPENDTGTPAPRPQRRSPVDYRFKTLNYEPSKPHFLSHLAQVFVYSDGNLNKGCYLSISLST